jgi:hypothetical protein
MDRSDGDGENAAAEATRDSRKSFIMIAGECGVR